MKTAQELGREWETEWAKKIQGELQPGSGNQWHSKLDVRSLRITWSCKYTGQSRLAIDRGLVDEIRNGTIAPGGNGSIPAFAIKIEHLGEFVVMEADDFLYLYSDNRPLIKPDKGAAKIAASKIPELLKD